MLYARSIHWAMLQMPLFNMADDYGVVSVIRSIGEGHYQVEYESIFDNSVTFGIVTISDIDFSLCYKCTWFCRETAHLLKISEVC